MSYGGGAALQEAVYARLIADPALDALVDGAVHDAVPSGTEPDLYVLIGSEQVRDRSDRSGSGAEHRFRVSVISDATGFKAAKQAAAAVSVALEDAPLALDAGRLVGLWFYRAETRRHAQGAGRRIDLTFVARIEG